MKIVPVIKSSDLAQSVKFYTEVLEFARAWPEWEAQETANGVAGLACEGEMIQLSIHAGDGTFGNVIRVFVDDIDARYERMRARGLDTGGRPESPVHTVPVDQTWGLREFAVGDPDGNGLLFCQPIA